MTNNTPYKPNAPQSDRSAQQTPRGVYNPITLNDTHDDREPSWLDNFESPAVRLFVALLFATIFGIALYRSDLGPVTIIVVAGCLLFRLEPWQRKFAAAPLLLAAIRLCLLLPAYVSDWTSSIDPFRGGPSRTPGGDFGIPWLPAFLSVCLFYLPRKDSITLRIVVVESLGLILSSLLPGAGFLSILAIFHFTLFFAITIGLLLDLKPNLRDLFSSSLPNAAPITVRIPTPPPPRPAL
jgi:hypothetical protein